MLGDDPSRVVGLGVQLADQGAREDLGAVVGHPGAGLDGLAVRGLPAVGVAHESPPEHGQVAQDLVLLRLRQGLEHEASVTLEERAPAGRVDAAEADDDGELAHCLRMVERHPRFHHDDSAN